MECKVSRKRDGVVKSGPAERQPCDPSMTKLQGLGKLRIAKTLTRVAHSIAHFAIEWDNNAADASPNTQEAQLAVAIVHRSHSSVTQVLYGAATDPIYLTRRAYLLGTVIPDAKSFVRNILSISSLKAKILVLSYV
jgi:hypothetical protein